MASVAEVKAGADLGRAKVQEAIGHLAAANQAREEASELYKGAFDGAGHAAVEANLAALATMGTEIEEAQAAGLGAIDQANAYTAGL